MDQRELENQLAYLVHGGGNDRAMAQAKISRHCKELQNALTASESRIKELELLLQREPAQGHTKMWQDQRKAILAKRETK